MLDRYVKTTNNNNDNSYNKAVFASKSLGFRNIFFAVPTVVWDSMLIKNKKIISINKVLF